MPLMAPRTADPRSQEISWSVLDFAGGLNTKSSRLLLNKESPYSLRPNQLTLLENLDRNESGQLVTRTGTTKLHSAVIVPPAGDGVIRSLFQYKQKNGTRFLLNNAGNSVYKFSWGSLSWSSIGTLSANNKAVHWAGILDLMVGITDGQAFKYDGATLAALGGTPPAGGQMIATYRNRLFIAKDLSLYFCKTGTPENWTDATDAGVLPIPTLRGSRCTALFPFYDHMLVLTDREVLVLYGTGPTTFRFELINVRYGNEAAPEAVFSAGNDIFYVSKRGVHKLQTTESSSEIGNIEEQYASGFIEPSWQALHAANLVNRTAADITSKSQAIFLCGELGANNNVAYIADYFNVDEQGRPTWGKYTNYPYSVALEVRDDNDDPFVLLGGYDGFVWKQDAGVTDDATNITIKFKYLTDLGVPEWIKLWRYLTIFLSPADALVTTDKLLGVDWVLGTDRLGGTSPFTVTATFDFGDTSIVQQVTQPTPPAGTFSSPRVSIPGVGRHCEIEVSFSGARRLTIAGLIFFAGLRRLLP